MRLEGYYWVRLLDYWTVGFYEFRNPAALYPWQIIGDDRIFKDSDFQEIDERRIERPTT